MSELVSIIIPTYNRARLVRRAVASALAQTDPDREVVVVDDGSTDETPAVLAALGSSVRVLRQANAGVEAARNAGAGAAAGTLLYFLDADDVLRPEAVARLSAALAAAPDASMAYGRARDVDAQGAVVREYGPAYDRPAGRWEGPRELAHLLIRNYLHPGAVLLRREVWQRTGGFDPRCGGAFEDWDLWARCARGAAVCYVPEIVLDAEPQAGGLSGNFGAEAHLRVKRHILDAAFADPATARALAADRDRIEAYYLYDVAWMAYAGHDTATARQTLAGAARLYPPLLSEREVAGARGLRLRLRVPRPVMEAARALKGSA